MAGRQTNVQDGESTCDSLGGKRVIVTGRETSSVCVSVCVHSVPLGI